ncbi:MAG TPA: hypothetical protein VGO28_12945 [Acidimicrobiia bacterium]
MNARRAVRRIVDSVFVVSVAAAGFAVVAPAAGAGAAQIQCHVQDGDVVLPELAQPVPPDGRVVKCAQLEVTKTVTGTPTPAPPPGTTYSVVVDCKPSREVDSVGTPGGASAQQTPPEGQTPPFTTTLTFPANGGTQSVFITRDADCTVSESPPPGCTLKSIDPGTTEVRSPILYGVTVTNNCDPAVETTPAVAVAPAAAVVATPLFTG